MRRSRSLPDVPHGELNVVPYLDVLMNLILFMLLSVAGLGAWGVIRAGAAHDTPAGAAADAPTLVVAIGADGFDVSRFGDGDALLHDVDALAARAAAVRRSVSTRRVLLVPAPGVSYATVVAAMDALRATPDGRALFPDVALALGR